MVRAAVLGTTQPGGDKYSDLVAVTDQGVYVYEGQEVPVCAFKKVAQLLVGEKPKSIAVADLNADDFADFVIPLENGFIAIAYGIDGIQWVTPDINLKVESATWGPVEIADVNGDGFLDIVALELGAPRIHFYMNTGLGEFWPIPYLVDVAPGTNRLLTSDLDQDGCIDVLTLSPLAKAVAIHRNRISKIGVCATVQTVTP